jgi:hypothetical protein
MALGAVYIRPQPLTLPATDAVTPADVLSAFAESILKDPEGAVPAFQIIVDVAPQVLTDFFARMEERLRFADGKIRNVFEPFIAPVTEFIGALGKSGLEILPQILESISKILDQLTSDGVANLVRQLFGVLENDLGISGTTLRNLFTDLMTAIIERLQSRVTSGETSDEAVALYDFGAGLDDLRLLLERDIEIPTFNVDVIVDAIRTFFVQARVDRFTALIREVLKRGDEVLQPLADIADAIASVSVSVNVQPSNRILAAGPSPKPKVGSDSDPTAWYASWVAGNEVRYPESLKNPTIGVTLPDLPAGTPTRFDNDFLRGFTYGQTLDRDTMESIARKTAFIFPVFEGFLHLLSIEQGDISNNSISAFLNIMEVVTAANGVRKDENDTHFEPRAFPFWVKGFLWPGLSILARSLECIPGFVSFTFLISIVGADLAENLLYRRWTFLGRELLLSILTLINNDRKAFEALRSAAPADQQPFMDLYNNGNSFDGVCMAVGEFGTMLLPLIFSKTKRESYGLYKAGSLDASIFGFMFLSSVVFYPLFIFIGYLVVRPLTHEPIQGSDTGHLFRVALRERMFRPYDFSNPGDGFVSVIAIIFGIGIGLLDYLIFLHLFTNGHTDDGKLAVDSTGQDANQQLGGTPNPTKSPYLLPFGDSQQMCIQGNLAMISHNPRTGGGAAYAFDFALSQGQEVLCSRPGIIVNIDDTIPTGKTGGNWNFVEIMHLVLNAPNGSPPLLLPTPPKPPLPAGVTLPPQFFAAGPGTPLSNLPNPGPAGTLAIQTPPGGPPVKVAYPFPTPAGGSAPVVVPPSTTVFFPVQIDGSGKPVFQDGVTVIPAGTLFPPYWDSNGNLLVGFIPPLHPSAAVLPSGAVLPAYYQNFAQQITASTKIAFLIPGQDFVGMGASSSSPGSVLVNSVNGNGTVPIPATFMTYGHGIQSFMSTKINVSPKGTQRTLYRSGIQAAISPPGGSTAAGVTAQNQVLGQLVKQGQVIILADNTGFSFMNHVHVQCNGQISGAPGSFGFGNGGGSNWSLPFVYQDVQHGIQNGIWKGFYDNGVARMFTTYHSTNQRADPE